ncbi:unnamed protein product [Spodoptera littoralis]|uniref:Cuticular protein n=1 Tax=Spodoptera littoralis TaxID=7109 RepID=A0A9P0IDC8_SPOLI|nr:unnamed protein product [Spodoptera littoralis]CAH1644963.1 unnamed protein product [Spodoptera littoralis]
MEIPKLLILLCCSYYGFASHHGHTIPVENYETELQVLGESVEIPETPVRVVKITKTVAVKVPVPYPVKVIEKVPYPVHINKPYPVPVPQIVKVPHVESPPKLHAHEALGSQDGQSHFPGNSYQVQEAHSRDGPSDDSYGPEIQSYNGDNSGHNHGFASYGDESSEGSPGGSYGGPSHTYYGNIGGNDAESFESKNYNQAIKDYIHKSNPSGHTGLNYH